jgi:hypothetical protein
MSIEISIMKGCEKGLTAFVALRRNFNFQLRFLHLGRLVLGRDEAVKNV